MNLLHNLVHLAFGVSVRGKSLLPTSGAIYVVLRVLGFITPDGFGLVPLGGNDPWLHLVLAAGLLYYGFVHRETGVPVRS